MPICKKCGAQLPDDQVPDDERPEGQGLPGEGVLRCPLCEIAEEAAQDSLAAGGVDVSQLDASQTHDEEPLALDDADEDGTVLFDSEVELGSATAASAGDAGAGGTDVVASSDDADTDFELDLDAGDGPDLDDGFGAGGSGQQRDGGATHAEAPIEDDDRRPTLHGGAEERPATHAGAASLTRFDQVTPAPPVDSKAAATVELEQKIKQIWDGAQSQGSHPSATLQVTASHLEDDTHLSVSARPIAYPEAEPGDKADYRVVEFVNQGGMGRVYKAQQTSLGRQVAIKTLKDDLAKKDRHRRKFFAEASITGRLDHPNIVPIYDLGIRGDGVPFYSMKFVTGQPWDDRIGKMSKAENVRTLLDVCDAMAFAHSRQILHRDLKPENVMLGEYGEVLVADWGLAIHMERDREFNLGGTPLYMAPEMANHDVPLIGVRSDVYLLGAILFEVLEGKPPHSASGKTVTERLLTAAMNTIEPHRSSDELIEVALKALATNPSDRYATVQEFQAAIVECQRHAESRDRSERAATELAAARATGENEKYARALFAYQDAIDLWPENHAAAEGLQETRIAYAQNALAERDYALGLSLLDESDPDHQPIYKKLLAAQAEENARGRRLKVARNAAIGATVATLLVLGVSAVWINKERGVAVANAWEAAKQTKNANASAAEAKQQTAEALKQKKIAEAKTREAITARNDANDQRDIANTQRDKANRAKQRADREAERARLAEGKAKTARDTAVAARDDAKRQAFKAQLALTAADLAAFDTTKALASLKSLDQGLIDWEQRRLGHLCHPSFAYDRLSGRVIAAAPAVGTQSAYVVRSGDGAKLVVVAYDPDKKTVTHKPINGLAIADPRRVAMSSRGDIAIGGAASSTDEPLVEVRRSNGRATLIRCKAPDWQITALAFSPAGDELAVAHHSQQSVRVQTVRLDQAVYEELDPFTNTAAELAMSGEGAFVALAYSADGLRLAAIEDKDSARAARIRCWSRGVAGEPFGRPIAFPADAACLAFDPGTSNRLIAGGQAGDLLVCSVAGQEQIGRIVKRLPAHADAVASLCFSQHGAAEGQPQAGELLATASASGDAKVWSGAGDEWRPLPGLPPIRHADRLRGCGWVGGSGGPVLVTADAGGKVRTWPIDQYVNYRRARTPQQPDNTAIAADKQNDWLLVGAANGHTWLYDATQLDDAATGEPVADLYVGHPGGAVARVWSVGDGAADVMSLAFDPARAGSRRERASLCRWDSPQRTPADGMDPTELLLDLSSSGDYLAVAGLQAVELRSTSDGNITARDGLACQSIAALPTGDRFLVGDARGRVTVMTASPDSLARGDSQQVLPRGAVKTLATTRLRGEDVAYAAGESPGVYCLTIGDDGRPGEPAALEDLPGLPSAAVRLLACDGPYVAAVCERDEFIYVLGPGWPGWKKLKAGRVTSLAISGAGVLLANTDAGLKRWRDPANDAPAEPINGEYGRVTLLANGRFAATGQRGGRPVIVTWPPDGLPGDGLTLASRSPVVAAYPIPPAGPQATGDPRPTGKRPPGVATIGADGWRRVWNPARAATPVRQTRITEDATRVLHAAMTASHAAGVAVVERRASTPGVVFTADGGETWRPLPLPAGATLSDHTTCAIAAGPADQPRAAGHAVAWDAANRRHYTWRLDDPAAPPAVATCDGGADAAAESLPAAVTAAGSSAVVVATDVGYAIKLLSPPNQDAGPAWAPLQIDLGVQPATALAFSSTGKRLLAGAPSGRIALHDVSEAAMQDTAGAELTAFTAHRRAVQTIRFAPDGQTLLSAATQGEAILWPVLDDEALQEHFPQDRSDDEPEERITPAPES